MKQPLLISLGLLAAVIAAWCIGHWAAGGPGSMPSPSAPTAVHRSPLLPAPKINAAQAPEAEAPPAPTANRFLEKLLKDGSAQLTKAQLEGYLQSNHRDAESLVTASRLTGDLSLLREAVKRFPSDPRAQLDLAMRTDQAGERQKAIEALATADPDNALGSYLAAGEAFKAGNADEGVRRLMEGSARTSLDDYSMQFVQSAEEGYLAAGYSPTEAKAAAMFGLPLPHTGGFLELGRQMTELSKSYAERGDTASAQAMNNLGMDLGQRIQDSLGKTLILELVGQGTERRFLKEMDPGAVLDASGLTVQQRLDQIAARKDLIQSLIRSADPTSANLSPQLLTQYIDRQKVLGEMAAMQWLRSKLAAQH